MQQNDLGPGFPEWTELGQDSGLDPLGMQRPIEAIYQSLLPGISTITLRLRYYSFFPWLLEAYAKRSGDLDRNAFRIFQRRAEALYALVCARGDAELGVAGIEWATKELNKNGSEPAPSATVDFALGADPSSDPSVRYLRNAGGAFGGIYASQLREMNLVELEDPQLPIPYCKKLGLPLAEGFQSELGSLSDVFLDAVDDGRTTIEMLDRLSLIKPSRIRTESNEQNSLAAMLMGRTVEASGSDTMRRQTLLMLLQLAQANARIPKADEAKWTWFETPREQAVPDESLHRVWSLYQASDLCRLAYEAILSACLLVIRNSPRSRLSLRGTAAEVVSMANVGTSRSLERDLAGRAAGSSIDEVARSSAIEMLDAEKRGDTRHQVVAAFSLLSALDYKSREYSQDLLRWLNAADHFQSFATEVRYLRQHSHRPALEACQSLVEERVIKRHLWVACRKFRNQKAYTYLFEPEEGVLRYRGRFRVSPSSPRIDQAVQFLRDAHLLNESGITDIGLKELEAR